MTGKKGGPAIRRRHLLPYASIFIGAPLLTYLVGKALDSALGLPPFPPLPWNLVLGFAIFIPSLYTGIRATRTLLNVGRGLPWGELDGTSQTQYLVTMGPYKYTRNPMALGYSLLPCGMGVMFQSLGMALVIPATALVASLLWIKLREEPGLELRFGESFRDYRGRTPFLVPNMGLLLRDSFGRLGFTHGVVAAYALLPLACLVLLAAMTFSTPPQPALGSAELWGIGSAFLAICSIGALAAIRPSVCLALFRPSGGAGDYATSGRGGVRREGHHPATQEFSSHVLRLWGRVLCAGCTGLLLGAAASSAASLPIFFAGLGASAPATAAFWAGFTGMAIPIIRYPLYRPKHATVRLALGLCFVLGGLLLLTGVCFASNSLPLSVFTLAVILFLIFSRVMLSQAEHRTRPLPGPQGFSG